MDSLSLLLSFPIAILANFSYGKIAAIYSKLKEADLEKVFIKSFDEVFVDIIKNTPHKNKRSVKVFKELYASEKKNWLTEIASKFSRDSLFECLKNDRLAPQVSDIIFRKLQINPKANLDSELNFTIRVLEEGSREALKSYSVNFFRKMSEKQGIAIMLQEVLELSDIPKLLASISANYATREDVAILKAELVKEIFSRDDAFQRGRADYDNYIVGMHKYISLTGFSPKVSGVDAKMELSDVFIPVKINAIGDDQQRIIVNSNSKLEEKLHGVLSNFRSVVLGNPGAGKTTLLRYIALKLSENRCMGYKESDAIPIYIKISSYASYYKKTNKDFLSFVLSETGESYENFVKENLSCSNIMFLLDGLDEVTDTPTRIKIANQVNDFVSKHPLNQYIVTSRFVGYNEAPLNSSFKRYRVEDFSIDDIKEFAHQWYLSLVKYSDSDIEKERADNQSEDLIQSITKSPSVIRLASNPLLMTIIAMIHYKGRKLPNRRIDLYEMSAETFMANWVMLRVDSENDLIDKEYLMDILAPVAFHIHSDREDGLIDKQMFSSISRETYKNSFFGAKEKSFNNTYDELVKFIEKQTGLFVCKGFNNDGNEVYGFMHQTFQEYFAAIEFVKRYYDGVLALENYVYDSRWKEVIRLAIAIVGNYSGAGKRQASELLVKLLDNPDNIPELCRNLLLVFSILSDDVRVDTITQERVIKEFKQMLSEKVAGVLLREFASSMSSLIESIYRDEVLDILFCSINRPAGSSKENAAHILAINSSDHTIAEFLYNELLKDEGLIAKIIVEIDDKLFERMSTEIFTSDNMVKYSTVSNIVWSGKRIHDFISKVMDVQNVIKREMILLAIHTYYHFAFDRLDGLKQIKLLDISSVVNQHWISSIRDLYDGVNINIFYNGNGVFCILLAEEDLANITCKIVEPTDNESIEESVRKALDLKDDLANRIVLAINHIIGPPDNEHKRERIFQTALNADYIYNFFGWEQYLLHKTLSDWNVFFIAYRSMRIRYLANKFDEESIVSISDDFKLIIECFDNIRCGRTIGQDSLERLLVMLRSSELENEKEVLMDLLLSSYYGTPVG